jgi:hypothetical protein
VSEFYSTPSEAEARLERVLEDEPDLREVLYIEPIEFVTGGLNWEASNVVVRVLGRKA